MPSYLFGDCIQWFLEKFALYNRLCKLQPGESVTVTFKRVNDSGGGDYILLRAEDLFTTKLDDPGQNNIPQA